MKFAPPALAFGYNPRLPHKWGSAPVKQNSHTRISKGEKDPHLGQSLLGLCISSSMKVAHLLSLHSALPLLLCRGGLASAAPDGDVSAYVASQLPISIQGILNNIGPAGSKAPGVADGIVIASPSKSDPDCEINSPRL